LADLAVGVPDEFPEQNPRLLRPAVFFENRYDRDIEEYYGARTNNNQKVSWSVISSTL
jgi:FMN reductase (NADPH)